MWSGCAAARWGYPTGGEAVHIKVEECGSGAVAVNANSVKNVEETIQTGREITCPLYTHTHTQQSAGQRHSFM